MFVYQRVYIYWFYCVFRNSVCTIPMLKKKYNSPCFGLRVMALLLRKCFLVWYCWWEWHRKMRLAIVRLGQSSCEYITPRFANTIEVQNVSFQVCCEFLLGGNYFHPPNKLEGRRNDPKFWLLLFRFEPGGSKNNPKSQKSAEKTTLGMVEMQWICWGVISR